MHGPALAWLKGIFASCPGNPKEALIKCNPADLDADADQVKNLQVRAASGVHFDEVRFSVAVALL